MYGFTKRDVWYIIYMIQSVCNQKLIQGRKSMKFHIAICDDEQGQIEYLKRTVQKWAAKREYCCDISAFSRAEAFLFEYSENDAYDILLLDIEMGKMNGVELARAVREKNRHIQIVFITGYPDFMAEGFEVSALHYLLKPVGEEKLFSVLDRAVQNLGDTPRYVTLPVGKGMRRIAEREIRYAESDGHYILLHIKEETLRMRMTIPELEKELGDAFFRSSRSFVVGFFYVARITKSSVFLDDGTELPLGRGLYQTIYQKWMEYFKGNGYV